MDEPTTKDLLMILITQLMRNYDLALLALDPEDQEKIIELHKNFDYLCPLPFQLEKDE